MFFAKKLFIVKIGDLKFGLLHLQVFTLQATICFVPRAIGIHRETLTKHLQKKCFPPSCVVFVFLKGNEQMLIVIPIVTFLCPYSLTCKDFEIIRHSCVTLALLFYAKISTQCTG